MSLNKKSQGREQSRQRVGVICNEEHDVFSVVGDELRNRGLRVDFFEPGTPLSEETISNLDLLMNKKVDPHSFRALERAESEGIATWNGYKTVLLGARLVGYRVLERVGCRVPPVSFEKPSGDYVAKTSFDWHFHPDPEFNGEGDFYQELVPADPIDHKYYAVDTGDEIVVRVLRAKSKLRGKKEYIDLIDPEPELAEKIRNVMKLTDSQAIGVDFIESDDGYWAVDVNPAMSFRQAEMEDQLVESVLAVLSRDTDEPTEAATRPVLTERELGTGD
ncbi:hypothetical protein V5735_04065 (plasmid) [Haladaptatus sp. SPP-AMP-3]|uniref:hypothetical protein n=1 Tax=Haladaptatus sp. SPP-AMP-3 TaxID=3121295 RepID=UPI003C2EC3FD